jgi:hypothetical protein
MDTGFWMMKSCECGTQAFKLTHHCNLRTCKYCAERRKRRLRAEFLPLFDYFVNKQRSKARVSFLTISPENYESYSEGYHDIRKCFTKFRRTKYVKERLQGCLYVIEGKHGDTGWNVHIHAILFGRRLDNQIRGRCVDCNQNLMHYDEKGFYCANKKCHSRKVITSGESRLTKIWKDCSGRGVHMWFSKDHNLANYYRQAVSPVKAVNYMLKYVAINKEDFTPLGDPAGSMAEYIMGSRRKPLVTTLGCFYGRNKLQLNAPRDVCLRCKTPIFYCFDIEINELMGEYQDSGPPTSRVVQSELLSF